MLITALGSVLYFILSLKAIRTNTCHFMVETTHSEASSAELTPELFLVKRSLAADRLSPLSTYCLPCWLLGSVSFPLVSKGKKDETRGPLGLLVTHLRLADIGDQ